MMSHHFGSGMLIYLVMLLNDDVSYANMTCEVRAALLQAVDSNMPLIKIKENAFGLSTAKYLATGVSVTGPRRWPL